MLGNNNLDNFSAKALFFYLQFLMVAMALALSAYFPWYYYSTFAEEVLYWNSQIYGKYWKTLSQLDKLHLWVQLYYGLQSFVSSFIEGHSILFFYGCKGNANLLYLHCICRFVEGMAPVFSRSAWYCTWHLIQVTLIQQLKPTIYDYKIIIILTQHLK